MMFNYDEHDIKSFCQLEQPPSGSTPNKLLKSLTCGISARSPPPSIYIAMIEDPISLSSTATSLFGILPTNAAVLSEESAVPNLFLKASKFCKP